MHALVFDVAALVILGFLCALVGVYRGWDAAAATGLLVFLAYCAGRSVSRGHGAAP